MFACLRFNGKKFIHLRANAEGVLIFRIELHGLEKLASGMCPTRRVHDLWAPDLIVGRVAIALEDAFEVA